MPISFFLHFFLQKISIRHFSIEKKSEALCTQFLTTIKIYHMFNNFPYIKYFASNFSFSQLQIKKKLLYKIMIFLMPWVFFLSFKICFFFHLKIHVRNITFEVRQKTQTLSVQNQWSNRKPDYYFSLISGFCWPALFRELYIFLGKGGDKLILLEFYLYCSSYW